jgi:hypothetical protein
LVLREIEPGGVYVDLNQEELVKVSKGPLGREWAFLFGGDLSLISFNE